ncbi:MAG: hypothetical protein IJ703_05360 [Eubacterium sp.]|nr:hypothetical protein [Eubacterium sp.]
MSLSMNRLPYKAQQIRNKSKYEEHKKSPGSLIIQQSGQALRLISPDFSEVFLNEKQARSMLHTVFIPRVLTNLKLLTTHKLYLIPDLQIPSKKVIINRTNTC